VGPAVQGLRETVFCKIDEKFKYKLQKKKKNRVDTKIG